jgi:AraC-like DNA-binding protein
MLLCLTAYLMRSAPQWVGASTPGLLIPLTIGALLFPVAFWWLVHNAFEDRTDLPRTVWVAALALLIAGLSSGHAEALSLLGIGPHVLQKVLAAGFVLSALWRLWITRAQDLVSGRRVLRGWLLAYIGAHGLVVLSVELALHGAPAPGWLDLLNVAAIVLALAVGLTFLIGFRPVAIETLFGPAPEPANKPAPPAQKLVADTTDAQSVERLRLLMSVDCLYRDPELSLTALAQRLSLPEHRLRELIHRELGYRNFPTFVNDHRLQEVERRLADPTFDRRPILTLALEAGFGSVGPFNRAFRERHGVTPTAFRSHRGPVKPTNAAV